VVIGSVGEQDALAEQVGFHAPVHLPFDHLDAVDMAFGGAGAVGDGEPGDDGGPVPAESAGEAAQLADRAGLGLAGPRFEVLAAKRSGQTWPMGSAATCFGPPVPSFLSGLDGALRAGASRVCAGPAEMLAGTGEFGVRASRS
jgi:hypothetical protein